MLNEGYQIHNYISSSGSGTVINYGSGSDFLMSYGSGSTRQKVTVPTVPVPQHCLREPFKDSAPPNTAVTNLSKSKKSGSLINFHQPKRYIFDIC